MNSFFFNKINVKNENQKIALHDFYVMLLNLYFSIIIIILIPMDIAVISDTNLPEIVNPAPKFRDEIYRLLREVNKQNEQRIFENIYEKVTTEPTERDMNLNEMKSSLMKLLSKVNKLEDIGRYSKDVSGRYSSSTVRSTSNSSSCKFPPF